MPPKYTSYRYHSGSSSYISSTLSSGAVVAISLGTVLAILFFVCLTMFYISLRARRAAAAAAAGFEPTVPRSEHRPSKLAQATEVQLRAGDEEQRLDVNANADPWSHGQPSGAGVGERRDSWLPPYSRDDTAYHQLSHGSTGRSPEVTGYEREDLRDVIQ